MTSIERAGPLGFLAALGGRRDDDAPREARVAMHAFRIGILLAVLEDFDHDGAGPLAPLALELAERDGLDRDEVAELLEAAEQERVADERARAAMREYQNTKAAERAARRTG